MSSGMVRALTVAQTQWLLVTWPTPILEMSPRTGTHYLFLLLQLHPDVMKRPTYKDDLSGGIHNLDAYRQRNAPWITACSRLASSDASVMARHQSRRLSTGLPFCRQRLKRLQKSGLDFVHLLFTLLRDRTVLRQCKPLVIIIGRHG